MSRKEIKKSKDRSLAILTEEVGRRAKEEEQTFHPARTMSDQRIPKLDQAMLKLPGVRIIEQNRFAVALAKDGVYLGLFALEE